MDKKVVIKLETYKGRIFHQWEIPTSRKSLQTSVKKLLQLYLRCRKNHLLTKDIFRAIQHYARLLVKFSEVMAWGIAYPEYLALLNEIITAEVEDVEEEVVPEKVREHERAKCSICGVELRFPARIVYRKAGTILRVSNPVGIRCLNSTVGKLNDLIVKLEAKIEEQDFSGLFYNGTRSSNTVKPPVKLANPVTQLKIWN